MMLKPFVNYPVVIETEVGQVVGVLVDAEVSWHNGVGNLLVHEFYGDRWFIVQTWSALKTARSST